MAGNNASVQSGRQQKLYYNDRPDSASAGSGTFAAPVWVLIDRIGDLDQANSKASSTVDMRASDTTITVYGNKVRTITFTLYKKKGAPATADPVFNVLQDSYENDCALDIAMMDDDIATTGAAGIRGPYIVATMDKSEPVAGVVAYSITMEFADFEQSPGNTQLYDPNFCHTVASIFGGMGLTTVFRLGS